MSLTDLVKSTFDRNVLREQDIASYEHYVYVPNTTDIKKTDNIVIEQNTSSSDIISNLMDSYIVVNWHLQKADGTDIVDAAGPIDPADADPAVGLRASLQRSAWDLFRQVRLELANEVVDQSNHPGHVFNIKSKVSKSATWIEAHKEDMFYYPMSGQYTSADVLADPFFEESGLRLVVASKGANPSGVWSILRLKDVLGFANCKKLLPYCRLTLRLDKETDARNFLVRNNNAGHQYDLKSVIKSIKWYVPALKARVNLENEFLSKAVIAKNSIPCDWLQFGYKAIPVTNPTANALNTFQLFSNVRNMRHLFIAFQPQSFVATQAVTTNTKCGMGSYRLGTLANDDITEMYITVSGKSYPFMRYQGPGEGYIREVEALRFAYGKQHGHDNTISIATDNFTAENLIYYFDLSKIDTVTEENSNDVSVEINYKPDSAVPVFAHCLYMSEIHMQLDLVDNVLRAKSIAK
jgi:hypothetical protein